jgi:Xaa-Pro aminopeptidase
MQTLVPFPNRRKSLERLGRADQLDAFLVTNPTNVAYLTGFSGDSSFLLIARKRAILISDPRFALQVEEECPGLDSHIRVPNKTVFEASADVVQKIGARSVGFESSHMTVANLESLSGLAKAVSWTPTRDRVEKLRAVKDPTEIDQIQEAVHIAERAFFMFIAMLGPADTEKNLADAMDAYIRRAGGRCSSFPTIVAVGERSALPHAVPTEQQVARSALLLVDWGASGRFYKSDLTRVLATRKISPKLEKVYAVVLAAQKAAINAVHPGAIASVVDTAARSVIERAGFGGKFGHGLGHGIGLQVHEAPSIRQNSQVALEPGMVITIEPGIYLPGWGGVRIEDDVLVTPDGRQVLTSVSKELRPLGGLHRGE